MIRLSRVFQIILALFTMFALVRSLPLLMRLVQGVSSGARAYWWVILAIVVSSGIIWKLKRRPQVRPPIRDVTQNLED